MAQGNTLPDQDNTLPAQDNTLRSSFTEGAEQSNQTVLCSDQQQSVQPTKGSIHSIEQPSLPLLYKFNVPEQVGTNFKKFGTLLLKDETGIKVDNIEEELWRKPDRINAKILQYWLQGKGLPVTWESLLDTLRTCSLNELADQIQSSLEL